AQDLQWVEGPYPVGRSVFLHHEVCLVWGQYRRQPDNGSFAHNRLRHKSTAEGHRQHDIHLFPLLPPITLEVVWEPFVPWRAGKRQRQPALPFSFQSVRTELSAARKSPFSNSFQHSTNSETIVTLP